MSYLLLAISLHLVTAVAPAPAGVLPAKVVYVQGKELFVASGSGDHAHQITHDGAVKALPVWSKDGAKIAFLETPEASAEALGHLLVVGQSGELLHDLQLQSDTPAGGMRFIEALEWLDANRVAISGSSNPSLTETAIVDLATGRQEFGIYDDGPGADFSPDGRHVALTSGAPHFTPAAEREPAVEIDYQRVYPPAGEHIEILSRRSWSPDSRQVAFLTQDFATRLQWMVVAQLDGSIDQRAVELPAGSFCTPMWTAGEPIAVCVNRSHTTSVAPSGFDAARNAAPALLQSFGERRQLIAALAARGAREVDVWSAAGDLGSQARRVTIGGR
jgi:hypothetical protein